MCQGFPWHSESVPTSAPRPHWALRRDACQHATSRTSEHAAENLAADFCGAGLVVGHDPSWGRKDGDAEPVIATRQVDDARINPPARLRNTRNFANYRFAVDVFELDAQLRNARSNLLACEAADISLALQHFEHIGADLRGRGGNDGLPRPLSIADSRQHVSEGIAHRHRALPLPARLDHARDLPSRGKLAQSNARELEFPV